MTKFINLALQDIKPKSTYLFFNKVVYFIQCTQILFYVTFFYFLVCTGLLSHFLYSFGSNFLKR